MLYSLFVQILNMGITASVVILAVFAIRLFMRHLPKKYSYMLWLIVGIRLVCPFAVSSPVSVFNLAPGHTGHLQAVSGDFVKTPGNAMIKQGQSGTGTGKNITSENQEDKLPVNASSHINSSSKNSSKNSGTGKIYTASNTQETSLLIKACAFIWAAGVILVFTWNLLLVYRTKKYLRKAVLYKQNIYECDNIPSPFIMGLIHPRIYIPFRLGDSEKEYILKHEQYHIRRKDNIVKFIAFIISAVYWSNPLVWVSYLCMACDMEMSCDEYVLESTSQDIRASYSMVLLGFATNRRSLTAGMLSFGKTDTRRRVQNIMEFKKQKKWVAVIAVILIIAAGAICLTNPNTKNNTSKAGSIKKNSGVTKTGNTKDKKDNSTNTADTYNEDKYKDYPVIASEIINGYNLKLVPLSGSGEETAGISEFYTGSFALVSYKDSSLCDEYHLDFKGYNKMYFPKKGIKLITKDYDGDGDADDFSLGQGQTPEPSLGNYMKYEFFTVDEDGSIVKFGTSWNDGESITTIPGEYSAEFKKEDTEIIFNGFDYEGKASKQYTGIWRIVPAGGRQVTKEQEDIWQAVQNTMPEKVLKELNEKGMWHMQLDKDTPCYLLGNDSGYGFDYTLRLDFSYKDGQLNSYTSKGYGFVDSLPEENITEEKALLLVQKFAKEFCGKELEAVASAKKADDKNTVWQEETPSKYDGGGYAYFQDGYGATYLVQLNHNIVIGYNCL